MSEIFNVLEAQLFELKKSVADIELEIYKLRGRFCPDEFSKAIDAANDVTNESASSGIRPAQVRTTGMRVIIEGCKVRFMGSGPEMTVSYIRRRGQPNDPGDDVCVWWIEDDRVKTAVCPRACLNFSRNKA